MPFYDALKFILTTASGKVRRVNWDPGYYITRGFKQECMGIVLAMPDCEGKTVYEQYVARPHDMTADDWCIIVEDVWVLK